MSIRAYAALAPGEELQKYEYEPGEMGSWDVEIQISHCGICHSDIHLIDNDWGVSTYPLIPGHEIVGIVTKVGKNITHLKEGQRVGVGWQSGSCMECEWCMRGDENLCPQEIATCVGRPGGFAERIRLDGRFAFPLPDDLASENVAPLLCGGITVYSPLKDLGVSPAARIGIIGLGGLGHLAVQFAHAFGCEVTVFSSTPEKEQEARELGAHRFVYIKNSDEMKKAVETQDYLLSTVFVNLDWVQLIKVLRPRGKLIVVGASSEPLSIPASMLITADKGIYGSNTGNRHTIVEMLHIAARHGIVAKTEVVPMSRVNEAIAKVRRNEARYRMVLKSAF